MRSGLSTKRSLIDPVACLYFRLRAFIFQVCELDIPAWQHRHEINVWASRLSWWAGHSCLAAQTVVSLPPKLRPLILSKPRRHRLANPSESAAGRPRRSRNLFLADQFEM
jgi:hypothetical protein